MQSVAIDGHIEDLAHEMLRLELKAKEQKEEEELDTKMSSVWGAACSLMNEFGLNVVIMTGSGIEDLVNMFATGESSDRNVRAVCLGDNKYLMVDDDQIGDPPNWEDVLNLLHEAAHLLTGQYENFDEDEGVCQVELVLARMLSQEVYDKLVHTHRTDYGWTKGSTYASTKKGLQWKNGAKRAKHILMKFDIIKKKPGILRVVW